MRAETPSSDQPISSRLFEVLNDKPEVLVQKVRRLDAKGEIWKEETFIVDPARQRACLIIKETGQNNLSLKIFGNQMFQKVIDDEKWVKLIVPASYTLNKLKEFGARNGLERILKSLGNDFDEMIGRAAKSGDGKSVASLLERREKIDDLKVVGKHIVVVSGLNLNIEVDTGPRLKSISYSHNGLLLLTIDYSYYTPNQLPSELSILISDIAPEKTIDLSTEGGSFGAYVKASGRKKLRGLGFSESDGGFKLENIVPGSPASKTSGLKEGMRLVSVGGVKVEKMSSEALNVILLEDVTEFVFTDGTTQRVFEIAPASR
jgi:hypothetical protein